MKKYFVFLLLMGCTAPPDQTPSAKVTKFYSQSTDVVYDSVINVLNDSTLDGLHLKLASRNEGIINAEHVTGIFRFTDDIQVIIADVQSDTTATAIHKTAVNIFSKARSRKYDFGQNEKNVAEILLRLDKKLVSR